MGIAMLAVMLFHANDVDLFFSPLNNLRSLGFGGVDIFILLSALGLAVSLSKREQGFSEFMGKRASRILPAYYLVMVVYTLCLMSVGRAPLSAIVWNSSLLYYWVHSQGAFNWYIAAIMTFYAVTPFCFRKLKNTRHRVLMTGAGVVFGLAVSQLMIHDGYWNHLDFFYRIPVFFMGLLLGLYVYENKRFSVKDALFHLIWLCAGVCYLFLYDKAEFYLPLCYLFSFTTVPVCLLICYVFEKIGTFGGKLLRLLGNNSLEIYLLNVSFFSETAFLRRFLEFDSGHYIYTLITFVLNIVLGVLLHKAVNKATARLKKYGPK